MHEAGCYIAIDRQFKRADPLPLLEHLKRRGSMGIDWNEPQHAIYLGFVLFGWPLFWLFGWLLGRYKTKHVENGQDQQRLRRKWLFFSMGFYLVAGGYLLYQLLPLLISLPTQHSFPLGKV